MGEYIGLIIFLMITAVLGAAAAWIYLSRNYLGAAGKNARRDTARTLKSFALLRRFRVLSGIKLSGATGIENLLVGHFGVLLIKTMGRRGEFYGTMDGENWQIVLGGNKTVVPNPFRDLEKQEAALRAVFAQNNIYRVPVERLVVLSNRSPKTLLYITNAGEILMPGKLGAHLGKTKYEKDAGVDVEKVAAALQAAAQAESE